MNTYLYDRLHEAESGFILIIDRRQDGWGAVRSILLKISVRCYLFFISRLMRRDDNG